jgi:hypothetical protein
MSSVQIWSQLPFPALDFHSVLPYHTMHITVGTTVENGHPERIQRPHGPDTHCQWLGYNNFTFGLLCMIPWERRTPAVCAQNRPRRPRGGVDLELYSFFNLGARWSGWSMPRPGRFNPRGRPGIHCIGGWMGPRAGVDRCGKSRPLPGFDLRTVHPVASTTKTKHKILEKV